MTGVGGKAPQSHVGRSGVVGSSVARSFVAVGVDTNRTPATVAMLQPRVASDP